MKFEKNMYVRTDDGYINKIKKVNQYNVLVDARDLFGEELNIPNNEIVKASHNIKDLIAVGDIIKFDITDTDNYAEIQGYNCWEISCEEELNGVKEMIEMGSAKLLSIVTKEQFEGMAYRIGE